MQQLWNEVKRLVEANATHRRGFRLGEMTDANVIANAVLELGELDQARDDKAELADVIACLVHYAVRKGWSEDVIEQMALAKLSTRFVVEGAPSGPELPTITFELCRFGVADVDGDVMHRDDAVAMAEEARLAGKIRSYAVVDGVEPGTGKIDAVVELGASRSSNESQRALARHRLPFARSVQEWIDLRIARGSVEPLPALGISNGFTPIGPAVNHADFMKRPGRPLLEAGPDDGACPVPTEFHCSDCGAKTGTILLRGADHRCVECDLKFVASLEAGEKK